MLPSYLPGGGRIFWDIEIHRPGEYDIYTGKFNQTGLATIGIIQKFCLNHRDFRVYEFDWKHKKLQPKTIQGLRMYWK
jgi:hypothetical protein